MKLDDPETVAAGAKAMAELKGACWRRVEDLREGDEVEVGSQTMVVTYVGSVGVLVEREGQMRELPKLVRYVGHR